MLEKVEKEYFGFTVMDIDSNRLIEYVVGLQNVIRKFKSITVAITIHLQMHIQP